jgi:hypothetical protein
MYCKTTVISCFLWSVNKYIQNDFYFIELNEGGGIALYFIELNEGGGIALYFIELNEGGGIALYFIELNEGGGIALSTCFKLSVSVKF